MFFFGTNFTMTCPLELRPCNSWVQASLILCNRPARAKHSFTYIVVLWSLTTGGSENTSSMVFGRQLGGFQHPTIWAEEAKCGQASAEQPTREFREGNVHCQRQDAWRLRRRSGRSLVGTTRAKPQHRCSAESVSSPFIRVFERSVLLCVEWRADQPQLDCIPSTRSGITPASPCHTTWSFAIPGF